MDLNNKFVQSSLHGVLTAGAKYEGFEVRNPDYQGNDGETEFLTGSEAYIKTVSQSMMGTGFSPSKVPNPILEKMLGESLKNKSVSYVGESNGAMYKHGETTYELKKDAPSLGARPVAIIEEIATIKNPEDDDNEADIYLQRGRLLYSRIPESALTLGFDFDIPDSLTSYKFSQTQSYFQDVGELMRS